MDKVKNYLKKLAKKSFSRARFLVSRNSMRVIKNLGKSEIHFLHIGKNAGTQIQKIGELINQNSNYSFIQHPHSTKLSQLVTGNIVKDPVKYFFSVRSPASRFLSGFYSRKRKGRPAYNFEWSAHEQLSFSEFPHANDLAESLFELGETGIKAMSAIKSIYHCESEQINWFRGRGFFLDLSSPIAIIRQEKFNQDLEYFLAELELDHLLPDILSMDKAHSNSYAETPELSEKALFNLRHWYSQDYEFYRVCDNWMSEKIKNSDYHRGRHTTK